MIRSMLFLPANSPKMLEKGPFLGTDAIIFDLEDAVAPDQKDAARILLKHSLKTIRFGKTKKIVRINAVNECGFWKKDLGAIVPMQPFAIMLPKVEKEDDIRTVSYTHLDVYKRQGCRRNDFRGNHTINNEYSLGT